MNVHQKNFFREQKEMFDNQPIGYRIMALENRRLFLLKGLLQADEQIEGLCKEQNIPFNDFHVLIQRMNQR